MLPGTDGSLAIVTFEPIDECSFKIVTSDDTGYEPGSKIEVSKEDAAALRRLAVTESDVEQLRETIAMSAREMP